MQGLECRKFNEVFYKSFSGTSLGKPQSLFLKSASHPRNTVSDPINIEHETKFFLPCPDLSNNPWILRDLCLFLDGLDEYDGEYIDILNVINELTSSNFVRICVSSRPLNLFEIFYGDNTSQELYLQDLARNYIMKFAKDKVAEGTQFSRPRATDCYTTSLYKRL